jgi:hypothetical protein
MSYTSTAFYDVEITGNLNVSFAENSYLYVGPFWRINASTDGKILKFEYNSDPDNQNAWKCATPFIQFNNYT